MSGFEETTSLRSSVPTEFEDDVSPNSLRAAFFAFGYLLGDALNTRAVGTNRSEVSPNIQQGGQSHEA